MGYLAYATRQASITGWRMIVRLIRHATRQRGRRTHPEKVQSRLGGFNLFSTPVLPSSVSMEETFDAASTGGAAMDPRPFTAVFQTNETLRLDRHVDLHLREIGDDTALCDMRRLLLVVWHSLCLRVTHSASPQEGVGARFVWEVSGLSLCHGGVRRPVLAGRGREEAACGGVSARSIRGSSTIRTSRTANNWSSATTCRRGRRCSPRRAAKARSARRAVRPSSCAASRSGISRSSFRP